MTALVGSVVWETPLESLSICCFSTQSQQMISPEDVDPYRSSIVDPQSEQRTEDERILSRSRGSPFCRLASLISSRDGSLLSRSTYFPCHLTQNPLWSFCKAKLFDDSSFAVIKTLLGQFDPNRHLRIPRLVPLRFPHHRQEDRTKGTTETHLTLPRYGLHPQSEPVQ